MWKILQVKEESVIVDGKEEIYTKNWPDPHKVLGPCKEQHAGTTPHFSIDAKLLFRLACAITPTDGKRLLDVWIGKDAKSPLFVKSYIGDGYGVIMPLHIGKKYKGDNNIDRDETMSLLKDALRECDEHAVIDGLLLKNLRKLLGVKL